MKQHGCKYTWNFNYSRPIAGTAQHSRLLLRTTFHMGPGAGKAEKINGSVMNYGIIHIRVMLLQHSDWKWSKLVKSALNFITCACVCVCPCVWGKRERERPFYIRLGKTRTESGQTGPVSWGERGGEWKDEHGLRKMTGKGTDDWRDRKRKAGGEVGGEQQAWTNGWERGESVLRAGCDAADINKDRGRKILSTGWRLLVSWNINEYTTRTERHQECM